MLTSRLWTAGPALSSALSRRILSIRLPTSLIALHPPPCSTPTLSSSARCLMLPTSQSSRMKNTMAGKGKGKRDKTGAGIDDLLDELDSDDEDENHKSPAVTEEEVVFQSPVARFIHESSKGSKKKGDAKAPKTKGKSSHHEAISYVEVKTLVDIDRYWSELEQQIEAMKQHFIHQLTLRSAIALDDLSVELEGDKYPLHELASISKKDPKRVAIDCASFPQAASSIVKAIQSSGMNLNPQQEGTRIFVPIPKVTKEFREKLAKGAKSKFQDTREDLRKVQSKYVSLVNDHELQHAGPKDRFHAARDVLLAINEHFAREAEAIMLNKQQELLGNKG